MKVFLDTNVILDFYQVRDDFFRPAAIIFDLGFKGEIDLVVSSLSVINANYILRKYYEKSELNLKLRSILNLCKVSIITQQDLRQALDLNWSDFEDCTQYLSALSAFSDILITRNTNDFKSASGLRIMSPCDFVNEYLNGIL